LIARYFKLAENHTSVKQEMLGGLTTFVTMAYIIVVNPQILAQAGMPPEGVLFATCISAAAATLVMGLYANYPIALAPGMSLNAYFTYAVCLNMHVPWQTALAVVFFSGVLFLVLTVTGVREQIVNGMPDCLKHSTATGIGMFIAFGGLRNAKLVVANPATFVGLGSFSDKEVQTACFGLALTIVLVARKVNGGILIGILGTTLLGILRGISHWPTAILSFPHPSSTFLKLDFRGASPSRISRNPVCILVRRPLRQCRHAGRGMRAGRLHQRRQDSPRRQGFGSRWRRHTVRIVDRNVHGHQLYRKRGRSRRGSAHWPEQCRRRRLFLLATFCSPLATAIPAYATAPALILVGALMTQSISHIELERFQRGGSVLYHHARHSVDL
jgi:AGZA family xanthine/uracil permease-like MFS transporter